MADLPQEIPKISTTVCDTNAPQLLTSGGTDAQTPDDSNRTDSASHTGTVLDFSASIGSTSGTSLERSGPSEGETSLDFSCIEAVATTASNSSDAAFPLPSSGSLDGDSLDFHAANVYNSDSSGVLARHANIETDLSDETLDFHSLHDVRIDSTLRSAGESNNETSLDFQAPTFSAQGQSIILRSLRETSQNLDLEFSGLPFDQVESQKVQTPSADRFPHTDMQTAMRYALAQAVTDKENRTDGPGSAAEKPEREQDNKNENRPRTENQPGQGERETRASERTEGKAPRAERQTPRVNQWEFAGSVREGVDRLRLQSSYTVPRSEFFSDNPGLERRMPETGGDRRFSLRHPTTSQVDTGWTLSAVNERDGTVTLTRPYEIEVRARENHNGLIEALPGVPDEFVRQLQRKLDDVPENVRNSLARHGYRIIAAPTIPAAIPELARLAPRGWSRDLNFYNSDGTHDDVSKRIIAPMQYRVEGELVDVERPNVVTHQIGHALDFAHNFLSSREEFVRAYTRDMENVRQRDRDWRFNYLSQENGVGRQETFASIFGLLTTGPENETDREYFERNFPNVIEVVRRQIKELR